MLVGTIRNQIDDIWNDFWSGGVSNPISVIEQLTYLLFIRRLDELQTVEERKAEALKTPIERRIFPEGADDDGEPYPARHLAPHAGGLPAERRRSVVRGPVTQRGPLQAG
ncbi:type I restriction-modification system subunit M N-terminal domain-containing protein [Caulobacter sp. LjRoot300]|uniref:type I restriction-modification system subunit M N-terminal domain-containing protein n=1 Tax=Caulobacter sp. LjRoot300 TaxID=3342321 RepID=UPI003ED1473B